MERLKETEILDIALGKKPVITEDGPAYKLPNPQIYGTSLTKKLLEDVTYENDLELARELGARFSTEMKPTVFETFVKNLVESYNKNVKAGQFEDEEMKRIGKVFDEKFFRR